jgi:chemosensory pili system protein ChpC
MSRRNKNVTDTAPEELYSLLVPLNGGRLIVPRSCVAEVIRYAIQDGDDAERGPDWFRGFVLWNNAQVPIIRFEDLSGLVVAEPGGRTRVAIFNSLSGESETGVFGILTEGFPQLVRVNRDVMEPYDEHPWPEDGPVICQIKMINEYPLIPDLDHLEAMIQKHLSEIAPAATA